MPFFEGRHCDDCGADWDEIDFTKSVVVGTINWQQPDTFTLYTCPNCHLKLRVQRETDGNSWSHWVRTLPSLPMKPCDILVAEVAGQISTILAQLRSIYQPAIIHLDSIDCVTCNVQFVFGSLDPPLPVCPKCGSVHSSPNGHWGHMVLRPYPPVEN